MSDEICGYLQRPGPELMVVDEVHILKDTRQDLPAALQLVRTKRRIGLTGTPFQNNLGEYFAMLDFVRPGCLGERSEFQQHYVSPIEAGQHSNSRREDVNRMRRRTFALNKKLRRVIHRRDHTVLEQVIYCNTPHPSSYTLPRAHVHVLQMP